MSKRVLCEIQIDEWTNMECPYPYNCNEWFTDDCEGLRNWKKEVLTEHPELKGHLRIMLLKTMENKQAKVQEARELNPAYREYQAYVKNCCRWCWG